eukprot:jgi/Phyca11/77166/gw1.6.851.1
MDASNMGVAVLDPASDEFIQVKFDVDELQMINLPQATDTNFSINVREHMCIALAGWTWGPKWSRQAKGWMLYIKCWSDNTSAVVWCNTLHSGNAFSQELNRCIGLAEAYFNLRVSAAHIPGSINAMADAASRAWTEPYQSRWTNFSSCWTQAQQLQSRSLASTSATKYSATWSQWCTWCEWLNLPRWLPESPQQHSYQLALFAVYCWQFGWNNSRRGNTAGTVLSKISHIAWHHRKMLGYSVQLLPGHQLAITGMRRSDPP